MNRIQITTTNASIEINSRRATMKIMQPRPRLSISKQPASMRLNRQAPMFNRNLAKFQASYGSKNLAQFATDNATEAKAIATEYIGQIASEGTQIMNSVLTGENVIADLPAQHIQQQIPDINVMSVPPEPVNLDWTAGSLNVEWQNPSIEMKWDVSTRPQIEVEAHSVEVKIKQYPEIKITVSQKANTHPIGRKLDKKI